MSVKFANNAFGTLNAGINNSATSITLSSGQGARFPSLSSGEYFYATLIDTSNNLEVVKCTARSTDVLTVTRAQESTTAQAFAIGDRIELRVTAQGLDDAANPYDKDTSSTGSLALPQGTTAQQPTASTTEGHIRYDTDDSVVYYSNGTNWLKVSATIPILSSVTGAIIVGNATTLTLTGSGFLASNLEVNFDQTSDSIDETITVTPASDTSATVTITSAIYSNVTAGNSVSVTITNSDGVTSAAVNTTAVAVPSGGTVTTSGGYRIHTFTSSGTFTANHQLTSVEYLVVAGGGAGGADDGGGGGAGGYRCSASGESSGGGASAESSQTVNSGSYSVTVGAGQSVVDHSSTIPDGTGGNSVFNGITASGGGRGGHSGPNGTQREGVDGGSGGGDHQGIDQGGTAGLGTSGQGFNGGLGDAGGSPVFGGGGGGSGEAGNTDGNGYGGDGVTSSITGSAVTRGGGGGGGHRLDSSFRPGGDGGGGRGSHNTASNTGTAGSANTGGGGGGGPGSGSNAQRRGHNGGSGVVIIRYQL